ncbi:hypothetical protein MC885_018063, partial [Smutsia gigantea]
MESPTKEIEEFESNSLKYLQPEQIEKIWLRLRGLRKYKKTSQRLCCALLSLVCTDPLAKPMPGSEAPER